MGSEPVDRTKIKGVVGDTSEYRTGRSIEGLSTNVLPRFSDTKSTAANTTYNIRISLDQSHCWVKERFLGVTRNSKQNLTFCSLKAFTKINFWKLLSLSFQSGSSVISDAVSSSDESSAVSLSVMRRRGELGQT